MLLKVRNFLYYAKQSFLFLLKMSKEYVILNLLGIILRSVNVFPSIYLARYSVELITRQVDFPVYLRTVGIILLASILLSFTEHFRSVRFQYVKDKLYAEIQLSIDKTCLCVDYETLQSKDFQERKAFAVATLQKEDLDLFIRSMNQVLQSLLIMAGVLYILSEASFWILIPFGVSTMIGLYHDYLNAKQNFEELKEETEYRRKSDYLQSMSRDFSYAKEIRLFQLKDRFKKRMDEVDELLFRAREARRKQRAPSGWLFHGSGTVLDIAVYLYFGYRVLVGSMTAGLFTACHSALWQMKNAVQDILYTLANYSVHTEALKEFFAFLSLGKLSDHLVEKEDEERECALPSIGAEIRFEHVSFRYPGAERDALHDVSITISPGEKLLVVGENGAGKSTFVKLLCGLYRPSEGKIYLNGRDISTLDPAQYFHRISAVFQDYRLFSFSIAENICALHDGEDVAVMDALRQVNLETVVEKTKNGVNTALFRNFDKDGVEFSGGETQRLAIARAIYKNAPVLVLDEPTSALDPKAEHEIYEGFQKIAENRTAVFISHRLTSVKLSDRIAVFEKGNLSEVGSHRELMIKGGLYAELYTLQAGLYHEKEATK